MPPPARAAAAGQDLANMFFPAGLPPHPQHGGGSMPPMMAAAAAGQLPGLHDPQSFAAAAAVAASTPFSGVPSYPPAAPDFASSQGMAQPGAPGALQLERQHSDSSASSRRSLAGSSSAAASTPAAAAGPPTGPLPAPALIHRHSSGSSLSHDSHFSAAQHDMPSGEPDRAPSPAVGSYEPSGARRGTDGRLSADSNRCARRAAAAHLQRSCPRGCTSWHGHVAAITHQSGHGWPNRSFPAWLQPWAPTASACSCPAEATRAATAAPATTSSRAAATGAAVATARDGLRTREPGACAGGAGGCHCPALPFACPRTSP